MSRYEGGGGGGGGVWGGCGCAAAPPNPGADPPPRPGCIGAPMPPGGRPVSPPPKPPPRPMPLSPPKTPLSSSPSSGPEACRLPPGGAWALAPGAGAEPPPPPGAWALPPGIGAAEGPFAFSAGDTVDVAAPPPESPQPVKLASDRGLASITPSTSQRQQPVGWPKQPNPIPLIMTLIVDSQPCSAAGLA